MVRIDAYLFGYRLIYPEEGGEPRLVTALLKLGIVAEGRDDGGFLIREADFERFRAYAGGRVRYNATDIRGLPAFRSRLRRHIPTLIGAALSMFLVIFLSHLVWDVRIEGAESLSAEAVEKRLDEAGLGLGALWDNIDAEEVELALLDAVPELAWVQINRRGTVAEVIIRERAPTSEPYVSPYAASNIVAAEDGVIEEITVISGDAAVKPGDVVRRGDVLISGIAEGEGGSRFTVASGSVRAHTAGRISVSAAATESEYIRERAGLSSLALRIFGLKINIFKNYGNSHTDCDIIENEVDYLYVFGKRLPVATVREVRYKDTERTVARELSELPGIASVRLRESLSASLGGADLIKLKTKGEYVADSYVLTAEYVISREIGEERELIVGG